MTVDQQSPGRAQYQDATYYFCSPDAYRFLSNLQIHHVPCSSPDADPAPSPTPVASRKAHRPDLRNDRKSRQGRGLNRPAGQLYHFCSRVVPKFGADPRKFLSPAYKVGGRRPSYRLAQSKPPLVVARAIQPNPAKASPATTTSAHGPRDPSAKTGVCPKCGTALARLLTPATRTQWTVRCAECRDHPGSCPICGMALEPVTVAAAGVPIELRDMTHRFWWSVALSIPLVAFAMLHMGTLKYVLSPALGNWIEFLLATPVVLWCGRPFFERGWTSIKFRSPNMFTLIAMGVGVAYVYSAIATIFPQLFPPPLRTMHGMPAVYFEAAAAIIALVLLGQVLELKARSVPAAPSTHFSICPQRWPASCATTAAKYDVPLNSQGRRQAARSPGEKDPYRWNRRRRLSSRRRVHDRRRIHSTESARPLVIGATVNGTGWLWFAPSASAADRARTDRANGQQCPAQPCSPSSVSLIALQPTSSPPFSRLRSSPSSSGWPSAPPRLANAIVNAVAV